MDPEWSPQLPLIDFSPFPGSLTHLGASWGLHERDGQTNEQGKIELLIQWTKDGWDEQKGSSRSMWDYTVPF